MGNPLLKNSTLSDCLWIERTELESVGPLGAAGWCAFTIQWIGLIKKSFHCEWSENTQFWLVSLPLPRHKAHAQPKSTARNHCQRTIETVEDKIKIVYSQSLFVCASVCVLIPHVWCSHSQSDVHMPVYIQMYTIAKLILTFGWKWERRISKTAKLRGMKRDNDLKLKIRHILWFQKVIRFFLRAHRLLCEAVFQFKLRDSHTHTHTHA